MLVPPAERLARRQRVAAACRRLSLSQQAVTLCEAARPSQEAFLLMVLEAELAHRETPRRTRLLNRAGFPVWKTLDGYAREGVRLPSTLTWADLETGADLTAHRNLVLYGAVGTGKSHLATALGVGRVSRGMPSASSPSPTWCSASAKPTGPVRSNACSRTSTTPTS